MEKVSHCECALERILFLCLLLCSDSWLWRCAVLSSTVPFHHDVCDFRLTMDWKLWNCASKFIIPPLLYMWGILSQQWKDTTPTIPHAFCSWLGKSRVSDRCHWSPQFRNLSEVLVFIRTEWQSVRILKVLVGALWAKLKSILLASTAED